MDLDESELKATRKLLGIDKEDKVNKFIKMYKEIKQQSFIIESINKDFFFEFVECLLSDYTRQKQINKEHRKENDLLKEKVKELEAKLEFKQWGDLDNLKFEEYMNKFILKQKIKNKIKELNKKRDFIKTELTKCYIENEKIGTETGIDNNEYYIDKLEEEQKLKYSQKIILEELLQESEKNNEYK